MQKSPRVLLIAYACAPSRGSEWGLSWGLARELARTQPVWVITHEENRLESEKHLTASPPEHPIHITYVTLPRWVNALGALSYTLFNIQYYFWQHAAGRAARRLQRAHRFDIVHHVSLVRWWMPTAAAAIAGGDDGAQFIFGPVAGGEPMPKRFRRGIGLKARLSEVIRVAAVALWGLDPELSRCTRKAALVIGGTPHAAARLARFAPRRLEMMSAGVTSSPEILQQGRFHREQLASPRPFRVVSSGGLSYYRGVDLCLRAFAKASLPDAEYLHASDGPQRTKLEALARELGIADRVKFLGDQPHAENVKAVASADVYMHTVLRDSQGLIPDAMTLGVPVLTLDHSTMALLVDDSCGHKARIDASATPERVIDELARVLREWHDNPALRARLGGAGMERAKQFTPAGRAATFRAMYGHLTEEARSAARRGAAVTPRYSTAGIEAGG